MQALPEFNEIYAQKEYWDKRYEDEDCFEWFAKYDRFRHLIKEVIQDESANILMIGCGNSKLSEDMYKDGYHNITNMDYSPTVIEKMRIKHRSMPDMEWVTMDMTKMTFENESFDFVLEKGTLDAFLAEEKDPWRMSDGSEEILKGILEQISSILKPGGSFISITFAQPHFRTPHYARHSYNWSLKTETFGETFHFFFYIMQKGSKLSKKDSELWEKYQSDKNIVYAISEYDDSEENEMFLQEINVFE